MFNVLASAAAALAACSAVLTGLGIVAAMAGTAAVWRFRRPGPVEAGHILPVTILRPLCGQEPGLEAALASICQQDYPAFQLVLGVQSGADPALASVGRIQARFPGCDIAVVVNPAMHGPNRKISNLINMLPLARHDLLVISDSDLHVAQDYLTQVIAALAKPGVGLVTTVCTGLPTAPGLVAQLGATAISHSFLPGALLARMFGRQDCLGTTMALRRETLAAAGGFGALVRHLADDSMLAQRVRALDLRVELARAVPQTAVSETSWRALWQHELRWARTIRAAEPFLFAASTIQFPLFWAALAVLGSGFAGWSLALGSVAWGMRYAAGRLADRRLLAWTSPGLAGLRTPSCKLLMLPVRDMMSVAQVAVSYLGARVVWRGHVMWADDRPALLAALGPAAAVSAPGPATRF